MKRTHASLVLLVKHCYHIIIFEVKSKSFCTAFPSVDGCYVASMNNFWTLFKKREKEKSVLSKVGKKILSRLS